MFGGSTLIISAAGTSITAASRSTIPCHFSTTSEGIWIGGGMLILSLANDRPLDRSLYVQMPTRGKWQQLSTLSLPDFPTAHVALGARLGGAQLRLSFQRDALRFLERQDARRRRLSQNQCDERNHFALAACTCMASVTLLG